jgi:hypothetical protein
VKLSKQTDRIVGYAALACLALMFAIWAVNTYVLHAAIQLPKGQHIRSPSMIFCDDALSILCYIGLSRTNKFVLWLYAICTPLIPIQIFLILQHWPLTWTLAIGWIFQTVLCIYCIARLISLASEKRENLSTTSRT